MPESRPLTQREIALAASVFGPALDPGPVRVHRAKYWAFHPWWVTMAPDGHIWCHPLGPNWSPDYAAEAPGFQAHFVHEMVHVWQYQVGGHLGFRRPPFARYAYALTPGKAFHHYGLEQQAMIVEQAFRARLRGRPDPVLEALLPFGAG